MCLLFGCSASRHDVTREVNEMPDNDKPTQQDSGDGGDGNQGQDVDLSAFFRRSRPNEGTPLQAKPDVQIVKKD